MYNCYNVKLYILTLSKYHGVCVCVQGEEAGNKAIKRADVEVFPVYECV